MSFEVDRYYSAWAHIALCADLTWTTEPPDEFILANQRLWTQHCRISQILQESTESLHSNQCESTDKHIDLNQENGSSCGRRSVKDVIPESRLAQFYGNFYYDEARENCYTIQSEKSMSRSSCSYNSESSDLTECWMLPEVEYWFRRLVDEPADRSVPPRRRRQYRMLNDDDFGRWGPSGALPATDVAALEARIRGVRALWTPSAQPLPARRPRAPSPPPVPRKIRARRRQPRRSNALMPPLPYCLDASAQLLCDPTCKFQFDSPRPPQLIGCQRAVERLSASVQAVMRANAARCQPYRGTNVTRYAPTGPRPLRCQDRRCTVWWPRDHPSPRLDHRLQLTTAQNSQPIQKILSEMPPQPDSKQDDSQSLDTPSEEQADGKTDSEQSPVENASKPNDMDKVVRDGQMPSTSAASIDSAVRKKRLYSTVLSMSAPSPINLAASGCVRLSQKLGTPGLLRLNPKLVLSTRVRPPNVDNKFEELEQEALEQYKASDESIDTKFRELEKQAEEQYNTSNSNTSCSSGNTADKNVSSSSVTFENSAQNNKTAKFHKEKSVDSVVIYSQNFPDLSAKGQMNGSANLKNFHNPPRGEKKDNKLKNSRILKSDNQRPSSESACGARESKASHKSPMRWTYHAPAKKRHLALCASDFYSDEELEEAAGCIKDAGPCIKNRVTGKVKMSAHGGGDLNPIMRKA